VRLRFSDAEDANAGFDVHPACLSIPIAGPILDATRVDGARVTLASDALFARYENRVPSAKECDARVGVRFETTGNIDAQFGGGAFAGLNERATTMHLARTDMP
jgi:hypothetical protein